MREHMGVEGSATQLHDPVVVMSPTPRVVEAEGLCSAEGKPASSFSGKP